MNDDYNAMIYTNLLGGFVLLQKGHKPEVISAKEVVEICGETMAAEIFDIDTAELI